MMPRVPVVWGALLIALVLAAAIVVQDRPPGPEAVQPIAQPPPSRSLTEVEATEPARTFVPAPEAERTREPDPEPPPARPGRPTRLVVPAIAVDAPVVPVLAGGGVLDPPGDPRVVGWWSDGARPGAAYGTALLTAHTVHSGGGAFDDLEQLRRGHEVVVHTDAGVRHYRVEDVTIYRKQSLARHAADLFSQEVSGRLALVTCEDWDGERYLSNTVVLASSISR